jgi:glycosyltransferase involved in cell wall biosynthesis
MSVILFFIPNKFNSHLSHHGGGLMNRPPSISACFITKDAEHSIERAIKSVQPWVDKMILIDTGSTDRTREIAQSMDVSTYDYDWTNDFSKARNYAINKSTTDFVLMIDSDEQLEWNHKKHSIKEFLQFSEENPIEEATAYLFTCKNIDEDTANVLSLSHVERLFPRVSFQYAGRIHEYLVNTKGDTKKTTLIPDSYIIHYGYSQNRIEIKSKRNIEILLLELKENPLNGMTHRYLANEYFNMDKYVECINHATRALALLPLNNKYSRAQSYYYRMISYLQLEQLKTAYDIAERAKIELPNYSDPYALQFDLSYSEEKWNKAIALFTTWEVKLKLNEVYPQYLSPHYDDFLFQQAQACIHVNRPTEAIGYLEKLIISDPSHSKAKQLLQLLHTLV